VARARQSGTHGTLHALVLVTLLTFDLVLFGAFTRLTDSGLGCPDWPGCYGHASPLGAHADITAAQTAMPTGPVTRGKAWIEMVHRYWATAVGGLIVVISILSWRNRLRAGAGSVAMPWWATATLIWVCVQGFGANGHHEVIPGHESRSTSWGCYALLALLTVQWAHLRLAQRRAGTRCPCCPV